MEIVNALLYKNPCYTAGKKITVKGLMLHSVGCSQQKASAFISSWNSESYSRACVHAFIDGKINYPSIARIVRAVLDRNWNTYLDSFETVFEADEKARAYARELI